MIRNRILPALVPPLLLLAACRDADRPADETTTTVAGDELEGTVTVLAAASLTDAFAEIAEAFEADHEDVDVELTFDGSAKLATVIVEGAPADVFASADEASMAKVANDDLLAGAVSIFAANKLQIVVPAGNPLGISSLDDLIDPDVTLSLCRASVPCGRYAAEAFDRAGLDVPRTGVQDSVKGVLTQVQLGEADAGIVYVTDVQGAEDLEGIDLAPNQQIEATYPVAAIAGGPNPEGAAAFVAFLTGDTAQSILDDYGFGPRRTTTTRKR